MTTNIDTDKVYTWEPDETELVRHLTQIVRQVDIDFQAMGGSSRHWVRDNFLPAIRQNGYRLVKVDTLEKLGLI